MKKSLFKRVICIVMCLAILLNYMPPIVLAADYPGMPEGMKLASSIISKDLNGGDENLWFVPCSSVYRNGAGDIEVTAKDGYFIAEATPNTNEGYKFSHWVTCAKNTALLGSWENDNVGSSDGYVFSKVGDKQQKYNEKDIQIQVNAGDWKGADNFYVYAVFVKGVSFTITVERAFRGI